MRQPQYGGHSEVSVMTHVRAWFDGVPLFTKLFFLLIVGYYLAGLLLGFQGAYVSLCLSPAWIVRHLEVWRMLTAVVPHAGFLHVLFNMFAFVPVGSSLERLVGTVQVAHLTLLLAATEAVLYVLISYGLYISWLYPGALHSCAIGCSGVIFGLIVVENLQSPAPMRSIFGLVSVPARLYPWALLFLWLLLVPEASFLGHLSGVLAGEAYVRGWLAPLHLPRSFCTWLEARGPMRRVVQHPSYICNPGPGLPIAIQEAQAGAGGAGTWGSWGGYGSWGGWVAGGTSPWRASVEAFRRMMFGSSAQAASQQQPVAPAASAASSSGLAPHQHAAGRLPGSAPGSAGSSSAAAAAAAKGGIQQQHAGFGGVAAAPGSGSSGGGSSRDAGSAGGPSKFHGNGRTIGGAPGMVSSVAPRAAAAAAAEARMAAEGRAAEGVAGSTSSKAAGQELPGAGSCGRDGAGTSGVDVGGRGGGVSSAQSLSKVKEKHSSDDELM